MANRVIALKLFITSTCPSCPTYKLQVVEYATRTHIPLEMYDASQPEHALLVGDLGIQFEKDMPAVAIYKDGQPLEVVFGPRIAKLQARVSEAFSTNGKK